MELALAWYGKAFLDASIGPVIRRMINEHVEIEVDPSRRPVNSAKRPTTKDGRPSTKDGRPSTKDGRPSTKDGRPSTKDGRPSPKDGRRAEWDDSDEGTRLLAYWCGEIWSQIYLVRTECPVELRKLFQHIRILVERRFARPAQQANPFSYQLGGQEPYYPSAQQSMDPTEMLPWQGISGFIFLRFIVPAILHPHLFGICPGMPSKEVQRSLTLVAKVTQSLANLNPVCHLSYCLLLY